jgi:hypothetical protein
MGSVSDRHRASQAEIISESLVYCLALFNELREDKSGCDCIGQLNTQSLNDLKGYVEIVHSGLIFSRPLWLKAGRLTGCPSASACAI